MARGKHNRRRDIMTPLLVTLSAHLMAFTLFINHRLFQMLDQPRVGQYVSQVSIAGDDPEDDKQQQDAGAAAGAKAPDSGNPSPDLASTLQQSQPATPTLPQRPQQPKAATGQPESSESPSDDRPLNERLSALAGGDAGGNQGDGHEAGGGTHGLRGEGKRGNGLKRHGGSAETENAVEMGLAWLKSVQDADGRWDSNDFMLHYLKSANHYERLAEGVGNAKNDVGLTGLCLLAYTGAGYDDRTGKYAATVSAARGFLLGKQRVQDGGFGLESDQYRSDMYSHSIATLALLDLFLLTGDEALRTPAKRALQYLLHMQGPGGGWDYDQSLPRYADKFAHSTRDDLSITGWAAMALIAAREANIEVPRENLQRLVRFLQECTRDDGEAVYADEGGRKGQRTMAMMTVSALCRRLLGEEAASPVQALQLERMAANPPSWDRAGETSGCNEYYWYYGSLCMLLARDQTGGIDRWRDWNAGLKRTLVDNQCQQGPRRGSFDPVGQWAAHGGGRVYQTALNILTLEVYYRYDPEYLRARTGELAYLWE